MTFIWFIVWLLWHMPQVALITSWNSWGTALFVCVVIDLTWAIGARGWRRNRVYVQAGDKKWVPESSWTPGQPNQPAT